MFYKKDPRKKNIISLLITFGLIYFVFSCAQAPVKKEIAGNIEEKPAQIESINVISDPSDKRTTIEITSSKLVPYAAFKLVQPLRLVVDFNALPAQGLTGPDVINDRLVKDIRFEKIKDSPQSTRVIAFLTRDVEYNAREKDTTVTFLISPKEPAEIVEKQLPSMPAKKEQIVAKEPRLFFSPSKTNLNQILGVDCYMLSKGKSRVTITTTKKAEYDLSRKNSLTLLLEIPDASIPSELTRYLNSSLFKGAVNRITPIVKVAEKQVKLEIELKEMVPYHVMQTDKEIRLDFNKTSVKLPAKKIPQARLSKALVKPTEVTPEVKPAVAPPPEDPVKLEELPPVGQHSADSHTATAIGTTHKQPKQYTGAKVTLDFANADIRNILKLIGEVSKLNIVWGSEIKGTVSMRLKNVPWDQALDILLETNNLGMRRDGNIIWVTTKEKIKALEEEEEEKRKAEKERIKEKLAEQETAKALEPLITAYIPVDFADAETDIKHHVERIKSERGSVSIDPRTNTVIITDIASIVEKGKNIIKRLDTPTKQIMIEARIVDASEDFSRDLGVQWRSLNGTQPGVNRLWQKRIGMGWGSDPTAFGHYQDQSFGGSFSSNAPVAWVPNIGLRFATLTNRGLGTLALDASLALGESEGSAKVISAPKVIASHNKEATISRGSTFYLPAAENVEPKEVEAKLSLTVTPRVSPNNYVTMLVTVIDETETATGKTGKDIKTELIVKSGDTIVIGGIYEETTAGDEAGIPGLSKIPFLGWLFKAQKKVHSKSELLVFLTPTVLTHLHETQK